MTQPDQNFDPANPAEVDLTEPLFDETDSDHPTFRSACAAISLLGPEQIDVHLQTEDGYNALVSGVLRVDVRGVGRQTLRVLFNQLPPTVYWKGGTYDLELVTTDSEEKDCVSVFQDGQMNMDPLKEQARSQMRDA